MVNNENYITAPISSMPPRTDSSKGDDAPVTYYWNSSDTPTGSHIITVTFSGGNVVNVGNIYNREVKTGDILIYTTENNTSVYKLTSTGSNACTAELIEDWNFTYTPQEISIDIDFDIETSKEQFTLNEVYIDTTAEAVDGIIPLNVKDDSNLLFRVDVKAVKPSVLQYCMLTLEFYTNNISPAMCSILPNCFDSTNFYSGSQNYNRYDYKTYRGYLRGYLRTNPDNETRGFDDEKLDNFIVRLMDYKDCIDPSTEKHRTEYTKGIEINKMLLSYNTQNPNSGDYNVKYSCYLFIYVPVRDFNVFEKRLIRKIDINEFLQN